MHTCCLSCSKILIYSIQFIGHYNDLRITNNSQYELNNEEKLVNEKRTEQLMISEFA